MFLAPILPYLVAGAAIAGTALTAYGQYKAGQAQGQAMDVSAQRTEREAEEREFNERIRLRRLLSSQRAKYGKAGVDPFAGSPLMVMAETEILGEKGIGFIRTTGLETAEQERATGERYRTAGTVGAGTTLLTGLGSTGIKYYKKKKLP